MAENKKESTFVKTTKKQGSLPGVDMSKVFESKPLLLKEGSEHITPKQAINGKK